MEQVYKKTGILFKILPCMLIAMYVVMCLFGASVFAVDYKDATYDSSTRSIVYNSKSYPIGETFFNYDYYCIFLSPFLGGYVYLYASNSPFTLDLYGGTIYWFLSSDSRLVYGGASISSLESLVPWDQGYVGANSHTGAIDLASDDIKFIYSNFDLKNENDEVVISKTTERGTSTGDGSDNTGNTIGGGNTTGDGSSDESSDTSWLGNIGNWFSDLFNKIGNIPNAIGEVISTIFSPLFDFLGNLLDWLNPFSENFILVKLWNFLTDILSYINPFSDNFLGKKIVSLIGDLLISLFVPENNYFTDKIDGLKASLNDRIPYQQYLDDLESLKNVNSARSSEDISTYVSLNNYAISDKLVINMNKFIDFSIFNKYKSTWFVWVRVVVYLLLLLYNINEFTKTLRGVGVINSAGKGYEDGKHAIKGKHDM